MGLTVPHEHSSSLGCVFGAKCKNMQISYNWNSVSLKFHIDIMGNGRARGGLSDFKELLSTHDK